MDFLESLVSSDVGLDELTHIIQQKVGHEGEPIHCPLLCNLLFCGGNPCRNLYHDLGHEGIHKDLVRLVFSQGMGCESGTQEGIYECPTQIMAWLKSSHMESNNNHTPQINVTSCRSNNSQGAQPLIQYAKGKFTSLQTEHGKWQRMK
jgi:hypothetical protein